MGTVETGKKAPDFTALDDRGEQVSLSEFKGRVVVLFFYAKDDTPG
jgi:peroxiredoxin Q/BCP